MLAGQEIGFMDVLMITAFGMVVSMAAMVFLWWFVVILSKAVAWRESKDKPVQTPPEIEITAEDGVSEAEIAAIIAAVGTKTGFYPNQYRITSISSDHGASQEEAAAVIAAIHQHIKRKE